MDGSNDSLSAVLLSSVGQCSLILLTDSILRVSSAKELSLYLSLSLIFTVATLCVRLSSVLPPLFYAFSRCGGCLPMWLDGLEACFYLTGDKNV